MNNKGITLVGVIVIVVLLAIVAFGIVSYISEGLRYNIMNINREKALYAAQAGIMSAIAEYVNNGTISEETDTQLTSDTSYSIGGSGMFFLADCSTPRIVADRKIKDISMTNLHPTDDITITHMEVSWTPDGGEHLISIDLGRGTVEWSDPTGVLSGTNIDMADFTIPANSTEPDVWLDWEQGSSISPMTITAALTFSDSSTLEIMLLNAGAATVNAIIITSTGKVASNKIWKRTLKVGYDVGEVDPDVHADGLGDEEIISWEESQDHF